MDQSRLKIENFNGVLYLETCMEDEFTVEDLERVRDEINRNFSAPVDVICKETGSYSVAKDVQKIAIKGIKEFRNVVYVASDKKKRDSADYAATSYMRGYNTCVVDSKEEAYS